LESLNPSIVSVDDIRVAARRIEGHLPRTPLRRSAWLSDACGVDVFLKLETIQPTFSFKIRGALNAVLRMREEHGADVPPLVTASAGNHGRALAYAARAANLELTVYAPEKAPTSKLDAIRKSGAVLKTCRDYDEAEIRAKEHGATGAALFVSPYSHRDVIAGAGTIGLEILDDEPRIGSIAVPIGGGGLISGIAIAVKDSGASCRIRGVEVEASCPFTRGIAAGRIVSIDVGESLADGLTGNLDPDTITFGIVRGRVDTIELIDDESIARAISQLAANERIIAEAAGAAATAAVLKHGSPHSVAVIVSGANIDAATLRALL
jgi:threonine dehydratase